VEEEDQRQSSSSKGKSEHAKVLTNVGTCHCFYPTSVEAQGEDGKPDITFDNFATTRTHDEIGISMPVP
jgi:hypothetical protein